MNVYETKDRLHASILHYHDRSWLCGSRVAPEGVYLRFDNKEACEGIVGEYVSGKSFTVDLPLWWRSYKAVRKEVNEALKGTV